MLRSQLDAARDAAGRCLHLVHDYREHCANEWMAREPFIDDLEHLLDFLIAVQPQWRQLQAAACVESSFIRWESVDFISVCMAKTDRHAFLPVEYERQLLAGRPITTWHALTLRLIEGLAEGPFVAWNNLNILGELGDIGDENPGSISAEFGDLDFNLLIDRIREFWPFDEDFYLKQGFPRFYDETGPIFIPELGRCLLGIENEWALAAANCVDAFPKPAVPAIVIDSSKAIESPAVDRPGEDGSIESALPAAVDQRPKLDAIEGAAHNPSPGRKRTAGRKRTQAQMELDAKAFRLHVTEGLTREETARECGWDSPSSVREAVKRHRSENPG